MSNKFNLNHNDDGDFLDDARVEIGLIGPDWSPLLRFRIFMNHDPENHLTIWHWKYVSKYLGTYTPPGWFLKIIGQIK